MPLSLRLEQLEPRAVPSVTPIGSEFEVNAAGAGTVHTFAQTPEAVATSANGEAVVTWSNSSANGGYYGVLEQLYGSSGVGQGSAQMVNQGLSGNQEYANAAMNASGGYVITWSSQNPTTLVWSIYARLYTAQGTPASAPFQVSGTSSVSQEYSTVAMDANGDFAIVWTNLSTPYSNIEGQYYNSAGTAVGSNFQVNQYTGGNQVDADVAMDSAGAFVVTWASNGQDGSGYGVYAQQYAAGGGAVGTPFLVNSYTSGNQEYASVGMNPTNGNFVITWSDDTQNGSNWAIYGQQYLANGTTVGSEFGVSANSSYAQEYSNIAVDPNGYFLVTWSSNGQDGSGWGVYGELYNASGAAQGSPFLVNTTTVGNQEYSAVAMGNDADPWVVWSGNGVNGPGVYGQLYAMNTGTDQPLTVTGQPVNSTEGTAFSGEVATFTDANTTAVSGDFTATITWGDGNTSTGTMTSDGAGGFAVSDTDTYVEAGSYTVSISITDNGTGGTGSGTTTATVADAPLSATGDSFSVTEGSPYSGVVATFTDGNPYSTPADFTATIAWGDGNTSSGSITENGSVFSVSGSYTYVQGGSYTVQITIQDVGGANTSTTATATVNPASLTGFGEFVNATEGTPFTGIVALFTDGNPYATTADFTATISWGDGNTSAGTITENSGIFSVSGTNTYLAAGSYSVQIFVQDSDGASVSPTSLATVAPAELDASGVSFTTTEGSPFSGVVATFTDLDLLATPADFTATITWGDGNTSSGTITENAGTFSVSGSNTYVEAGSYTVNISIQDVNGGSGSTTATATVNDAPLSASGVSFTASEGSAFTGVAATFTDGNPYASSGDFTATITWGDGNTSSGTITENAGVFSVSGGNTYVNAGSYTVEVSIQDVGGSTASATSTATVNDAALNATGVSFTTTEGSNYSGVVATFTDGDPLATTGDFSATITWGDGNTSAGTITENAGTFSVSGGNTYIEAGSYTVTISIQDIHGGSGSASATATVNDAALSATGVSFTTMEGSTFSGVVATFTDANPYASTADFTATITWGDGNTSAGTITENAGVFSVSGSNTYVEAGSYSVQIAIQDIGGSNASAIATATVNDAPLSATGQSFTTTEGSSYSGVVATFTDGNPYSTPGDFTATITWGDGNTSVGTVTENAGVFSVSGSNTYMAAGSYTVQISIQDIGGSVASASATATVNAASLSASGDSFSSTEGSNYSGLVATFTDGDPLATAADFTATITWGDGSTSTGTVSENAGTFSVTGSHIYTDEGSYTVQISIQDIDGGSGSATSTATINDASLSASGVSFTTTEGSQFSGTVATFTDGNPYATTADFTATITWGDGNTSTGTIAENAGVFSVSGSNTYVEAGSCTVQVSIQDVGGSSASATATATVNDAPLTAHGTSFTATEGNGFTGVVATFTDGNPYATTGDFTATITWGDGNTSAGTITENAGAFSVSGSNTYLAAGSYTVQISIQDIGGSSASTTTAATVNAAALNATGVPFSSTAGSSFSGVVATFTGGDPLATAADFTATITWGDGNTGTGTITENAGVFSVSASHIYTEAGSYTVHIAIQDVNGGSGSTTAAATVSDAPISAAGVPFTTTEGSTYSGAVATFTDGNPYSSPADFTATISWGDGNTSAGTVTENAGIFSVSGSDTYVEAGSYTVQIGIRDIGGSSASATATATVNDAPLSATGVSFTATEGNAFSGVAATFTDGNPYATSAAFTATITWGDGNTSAGTISESGGVFRVSGSDTYLTSGSYTVQVSIQDIGGSTAAATATATVNDAPITASGHSFTTTEGSAFTGVVTTFTDGNPYATAGDFTATITWGDGNTSTGTITESAGTFSVSGSNTFVEAGAYTVQVSIQDVGGSHASATATATVRDAALTASGHAFSVTEGTAYSGLVATFTDANPYSTPADFTVTIAWGDGNTSTGTITESAGVFSVSGSNLYVEAGSYTAEVSIHDIGGSTALATVPVTVDDAPLNATGVSFTITEGRLFSGTVATFTDGNVYATAADFAATITWGDGHTSSGAIAGSAGSFSVSGSNSYAEFGSYVVSVAVNGRDGATASATASAVITDAPISATGESFATPAGVAYSGPVATFTNGDASVSASDFSATITWGDGVTSAGSIVAKGAGQFTVVGSTTYATPGAYTVSVSIVDRGGSAALVSANAAVGNGVLAATGANITATQGSAYEGVVATFTESAAGATPADFNATIDWGDGQQSVGIISSVGSGRFSVTGSHTYAFEGTYALAVTVVDANGTQAIGRSSAGIAAAAISGGTMPLGVQAGLPFTTVVATFIDTDAALTAADFSASIAWGDGTTSPGAVTDNGAGGFAVVGANTYVPGGEDSFDVVLTDRAGTQFTFAGQARVAGLVVQPRSALVTTGTGGQAAFTVVLDSQPLGDVTIDLHVSDSSAAVLSQSTLVFTPENWNVPEQVTLTGLKQSAGAAGSYQVLFASADSLDPAYNGILATPLTVQNLVSSSTTPSAGSTGSTGVILSTALSSRSGAASSVGAAGNGSNAGAQGALTERYPRAGFLPGARTQTSQPLLSPESSWLLSGVGEPNTVPPPAANESPTLATPAAGNVAAVPASPVAQQPPAPVQPGPAQPAAPAVAPPDAVAEQTGPTETDQKGQWFADLDHFENQMDRSLMHFPQALTAAALAGLIGTAGYVILSSRGSLWLLSLLTARPLLWKRFDPVEILFAWEEEQERRRHEELDTESLQSLVQ